MLSRSAFKVITFIAKKIRGADYEIDQTIPLSSLLQISISRSVSLLRGILRGVAFQPNKLVFLGKNVTLINKRFISFGKHIVIGNNALINGLSREGIKIGDNVSIGSYSILEASGTILDLGVGITIGNNTGIGSFSFIGGAGGVSIGNDVIMGQWVSFHPENHNYESLDQPIRLQGVNRKGITVGNDCWIGVKVTFLDGANVGDGCIIAAGSIVRGDIPPFSIIAGVPAKVIKMRNKI